MEPNAYTKIVSDEVGRLRAGVDIISHAAKFKTYREILLLCYSDAVWYGGLKRLEDLTQEEKQAIWQETKKDTEGLSKRLCIELSKIVYLISQSL